MSKVKADTDGVNKALSLINKKIIAKGGEWEIGDRLAFVCDDGVILVTMQEGRKLSIDITAGVPIRLDIKLDLVEE